MLGANGQVGAELLRAIQSIPAAEIIPATRTGELSGGRCIAADLSQPANILQTVVEQRPDLVINAAAYTDVDKAESELELAHRINGVAPAVIANACAQLGVPMIQYSTD